MNQYVQMDLFISVSGCSMKTEEQCEIVKEIPLDRLLIESKCPYCSIRGSHFSSQYVQTKFPIVNMRSYNPDSGEFQIINSRNEPCTIVQVIEVIAALRGLTT